MRKKRRIVGFKKKLIDRSIEAYILSLGTINDLSITYRVENFAYLICKAWELLLKAKILHDKRIKSSIYYRQKPGESPRTLSLRDCMKKVFKEHDPVRHNIALIEEMRDEATHLFISQVPVDVIGLFQACVLNYHKYLSAWFNISLSQRVNVGMMTIAYDFKPDELDISNQALRRELGQETAEYLTQFQAKVKQEYIELGKSQEFTIVVGYRLAYTKNPDDADILVASSSIEQAAGVIFVPKDPSKTHPYREKELIEHVNDVLGSKVINQYDVRSVIKLNNIKKNTEYFYQGAVVGSPCQYSQKFADWLIGQYRSDASVFVRARQAAKISHGRPPSGSKILPQKYEDLIDVAGALKVPNTDVVIGNKQRVKKI